MSMYRLKGLGSKILLVLGIIVVGVISAIARNQAKAGTRRKALEELLDDKKIIQHKKDAINAQAKAEAHIAKAEKISEQKINVDPSASVKEGVNLWNEEN